MALDPISATGGFAAAGVSQVQQAVKPQVKSEDSAVDIDKMQDFSVNPDSQTVSVNEVKKGAEDGENGNGTSPQDEAAQKQENERIKKYLSGLNKELGNKDSGYIAQFGIHEKTNRVTIKILDKNTHKAVREYPPEESLDLLAKLWENAGILVDEKK